MRAVGLITEYNPLHNGHLHHLQQSRLVAGAEVGVAVMSGNFLQRGEPALLDKWQRAEMALSAGVDLVVELPLPWACNSAPLFADGAVACLDALTVDALCFGSESGVLADLQQTADWLRQQAGQVDRETRRQLRQGKTWPQAREMVANQLGAAPELQERLRHPNNILGLEYLRALEASSSRIEPRTIERIGAGYHQKTVVDQVASATGIRARLERGEAVAAFMPAAAAELLATAVNSGLTLDSGRLFQLLAYALQREPRLLERIYQLELGLVPRLQAAAADATDYTDLVDRVKSRQLTRTRIQRLLSYALLEIDAGLMRELLDCGPLYLHLLGQSRAGEAFLNNRRKEIGLPLVSNYSRIENQLQRTYEGDRERLRLAREQLNIELRATRIYTLLQPGFAAGNRNRDYYEATIRYSPS